MIIVEKKLSKHLLSLTQLNSTQLNSAQFSIKPDYLPSVQILFINSPQLQKRRILIPTFFFLLSPTIFWLKEYLIQWIIEWPRTTTNDSKRAWISLNEPKWA